MRTGRLRRHPGSTFLRAGGPHHRNLRPAPQRSHDTRGSRRGPHYAGGRTSTRIASDVLVEQDLVEGRTDLSRRRRIEIACASPARTFGLHPRKGAIAPGADADVVIHEPAAVQTLAAGTRHVNVDHSAYEGKRITGQAETVLSRGEVVIDERKFAGRAGPGTYTPRATCQYVD